MALSKTAFSNITALSLDHEALLKVFIYTANTNAADKKVKTSIAWE